ncbi:hypothetical protein ASG40_13405 [Methylobacterium sp. Leaf399]|uniref:hypothetical protein n=1 Tax=unclassified Methylobacterium TaxID=2615210 RepID=UPI0006FFBB27|nr:MULTISPECIES: hypothetical protein [unclassified Methylobacterium]KQP50907.1 hypothetical protein ASF39_11775 [Methylobacterium sp. Leaf108]KQT07892.1 hypothetical protein ASG40_13405 [Methylobacterium sp. Leaf399]KQT89004.1 hypothetical protein ASG59_14165 [Methylobacterium sp. Leaf466]
MRYAHPRTGRLLLAAGLLSLVAACNSAKPGPTASLEGFTPDPALKTASTRNLTGRVSRACVVTQGRLQSVPETALARPCGCYAQKTLASLDRGELESYRTSGYFNDSAKAKALAALDACQLPRPV